MARFTTVATAVTGLLVLGAAAGTVGYASTLTPPATEAEVRAHRVSVPAGVTRSACAPAPVLPAEYQGVDADLNPVEATQIAAGVVASLPRESGTGGASLEHGDTVVELTGDPARIAPLTPSGQPPMLTAQPVEEKPALLAGGALWSVDGGDMRGMVALPCGPAQSDVWLVGGATTLGSSTTLTITNPGDTPATVNVEGWGQTGPLDLPMLQSLTVAPRGSESFLLEASDSSVERMALHLQSAGAAVHASLLTSQLDGFTPRGIDTVSPGSAPRTSLVIPGLSLGEAGEEAGDAAENSGGPLVRVANPGTSPATLSMTLLTPDGPVEIPGADEIVVDAGAVFDVSLAGVPAGDHAVSIESDVPVLAAAQSVRHSTVPGARELAWSPAVRGSTVFGLAHPGEDTDARHLLANSGTHEVQALATPYAADGAAGDAVDVTVPVGGVALLPDLGDAVAVLVEAEGEISAATVLVADTADGEHVAVLPGIGDDAVAQSVDVTVREQ